MAGIGFVLRKLAGRGDLLGIVQGYGYSAMCSTGPWLMTVASLAAVHLWTAAPTSALAAFRVITTYNFALSLILSGPVVLVATRYLADRIHERNVSTAPGLLYGALMLLWLAQIPAAALLYWFSFRLDVTTRIAATSQFFLIGGIWLAGVFLSALKKHQAVALSFAAGLAAGTWATIRFGTGGGLGGMLAGYSLGLGITLFGLLASIFTEFRFEIARPFALVRYFRDHWELALAGLAYNAAIWVDKVIYWLAPVHDVLPNGLLSYRPYDGAMFLAYLTTAPAMALFVFSVETEFFERYLAYYRDIERHAGYARIRQNQRRIVEGITDCFGNVLILQAGCSLLAVLAAPRLFAALHIGFTQIGMFRLGVLGAFFHVLALFLGILLSYLDLNRTVLKLHVFFFAANASLTVLSLKLGFAYFGYGYFLASILVFAASFVVAARCLEQLPYVSFIRANRSVQQPGRA